MIGQPRIEGAGAVPTHTSGPLGSLRAVGLLSGGGGGEAVAEIWHLALSWRALDSTPAIVDAICTTVLAAPTALLLWVCASGGEPVASA